MRPRARRFARKQSAQKLTLTPQVHNAVVVHHSFCGATAFTPENLIGEFHEHHKANLTTEASIKHDVELLRNSPAVPKSVKLYGFFYEMNSGKLLEIARDIPA